MNDYEKQQTQTQEITNKQCDAWIKRIEKRWGTLCNGSGQELSIEEKREMARRDLATSPHRRRKKSNEEVSTKKQSVNPVNAKNDLAATIIPEAIVVSQSDSCSSLLIRAGYQNIVNSIIIPSTEYLINDFYQNPNCVTLRKLGKIAQTADIVAYAIEHESPTAPAPILRFISKRHLTPELCKKACTVNGLNLEYVPEEWRTYEMCKCAVYNTHNKHELILKYVPYKILNTTQGKSLCEFAVNSRGLEIRYVPLRYCTQELWETAINNDLAVFEYIPKKYMTETMVYEATSRYPWLSHRVPHNFRLPSNLQNKSLLSSPIPDMSLQCYDECEISYKSQILDIPETSIDSLNLVNEPCLPQQEKMDRFFTIFPIFI